MKSTLSNIHPGHNVAFSAPEAAHAAVLRCILLGYVSPVPSPCPPMTTEGAAEGDVVGEPEFPIEIPPL